MNVTFILLLHLAVALANDISMDLDSMESQELEEICTSRGFDLVKKDGEQYSLEDYKDAAKQCLELESEMEDLLAKHPELLEDIEEEADKMKEEKERLENELDVLREVYAKNRQEISRDKQLEEGYERIVDDKTKGIANKVDESQSGERNHEDNETYEEIDSEGRREPFLEDIDPVEGVHSDLIDSEIENGHQEKDSDDLKNEESHDRRNEISSDIENVKEDAINLDDIIGEGVMKNPTDEYEESLDSRFEKGTLELDQKESEVKDIDLNLNMLVKEITSQIKEDWNALIGGMMIIWDHVMKVLEPQMATVINPALKVMKQYVETTYRVFNKYSKVILNNIPK